VAERSRSQREEIINKPVAERSRSQREEIINKPVAEQEPKVCGRRTRG